MKGYLYVSAMAFVAALYIDVAGSGPVLESFGLIGLVAASQMILAALSLWLWYERKRDKSGS